MDQNQAESVAESLGGEAWQSGGDIWLVRISRSDGKLVIISDEMLCEYADEDAFERNQAASGILLH